VPEKPSFFARWRTPLQILCAVLALAWVLHSIPWHDVATFRIANVETELEGELIGDWKSDSVRFKPSHLPAEPPRAIADMPRDSEGAFALVRLPVGAPAPLSDQLAINWRPGMLRVFREMNARSLILALGLFTLGQLIVVTRWWRLLAAAGLRVRWYESLRLTSLGLFFNLVVPGVTGGDLVKALLVARAHPTQRPAALVSIAFDRLVGLLCMILLAAAAVLLSGETFAEIRTPVVAAAGIGSLFAIATLSRGLRRAVGLEKLFARLPLAGLIQKIDEAVLTYSSRPLALGLCVALSFLNHMTVIGGILVLGRAFGDTILSWSSYFAIAPVATIISAIPIAPGGWGVREAAYSYLFAMLGASAAVGLATSISFGLLQMAISLAAGLFLFAPGSARISEMKDLH